MSVIARPLVGWQAWVGGPAEVSVSPPDEGPEAAKGQCQPLSVNMNEGGGARLLAQTPARTVSRQRRVGRVGRGRRAFRINVVAPEAVICGSEAFATPGTAGAVGAVGAAGLEERRSQHRRAGLEPWLPWLDVTTEEARGGDACRLCNNNNNTVLRSVKCTLLYVYGVWMAEGWRWERQWAIFTRPQRSYNVVTHSENWVPAEVVTPWIISVQSNTNHYVILQGIPRYYASIRAITGTITFKILLYYAITCVQCNCTWINLSFGLTREKMQVQNKIQ